MHDITTPENVTRLTYARATDRCQDASGKKRIMDNTKIESKVASKSNHCSRTTFLYIAYFWDGKFYMTKKNGLPSID